MLTICLWNEKRNDEDKYKFGVGTYAKLMKHLGFVWEPIEHILKHMFCGWTYGQRKENTGFAWELMESD